MSAPVRVLQVLSSTQRTGGVEAMIMNAYRALDRERVQFDFVSHMHGPRDLDEEMCSLGARVFELPFLTELGWREYNRRFCAILRENGPYHAVHTHLDSQGWVGAMNAKRCGIAVRVCHAHLDHSFDRSARTAAKLGLARRLAPRYATRLCACSPAAARSVFGRAGEAAVLVNNGIDTALYGTGVDAAWRRRFEEETGSAGKRVLLHVARLAPVKNHDLVFRMAAAAKERGLPWVFVCAGAGPLQEALTRRRTEEGLEEQVRLLGSRTDIPLLLQAADVQLLPSFMEGFPVVLVEGHAAGVPMLAADCVMESADLGLGLLRILPLAAGVDGWMRAAEEALRMSRPDGAVCREQVARRGFDCAGTARQLLQIYELEG